MRQPKRIPLFLRLIDIRTFTNEYGVKRMDRIPDKIKYYWKKHPQFRFTHVLEKFGYVRIYSPMFLLEDEQILLNQGVPPEEFIFWGQMYDSEGELLKKTRHIVIKDMNTGHIKKILAELSVIRISPIYETAFRNVLEKRSGNKASP